MKPWWAGLGAAALVAGLGAVWLPMPPAGGLPATGPAGGPPATAPAGVPSLALPARPVGIPPSAEPRPARVVADTARQGRGEDAALDALIAAARRGDAQAAHAAYRALAACLQPDGPRCPALPASLLQERLRFLAQAVRADLPQAQLDFYFEGPDRLQALDEQALQAWRTEALTGLQAAASRCEPLAAGVLATLYDSGDMAPRDARLAVAYAVAEGRLRGRLPSDASLRDRLAEPVDDALLAAGRQQGLALAAACR